MSLKPWGIKRAKLSQNSVCHYQFHYLPIPVIPGTPCTPIIDEVLVALPEETALLLIKAPVPPIKLFCDDACCTAWCCCCCWVARTDAATRAPIVPGVTASIHKKIAMVACFSHWKSDRQPCIFHSSTHGNFFSFKHAFSFIYFFQINKSNSLYDGYTLKHWWKNL